MTASDAAQSVGEACLIAASLIGAAGEAERQGLPVIAARMRQAADCINALVNLLVRR